MKLKFICGGNQVLSYAQHPMHSADTACVVPFDRGDWLSALRQRNREAVRYKISETCSRLIEHRGSKEAAVFVLMECISLGSTALLERGVPLPDGWMSDSHPMFAHLLELETVAGLERWLGTFFDELVIDELDTPLPQVQVSDIVRKAIEYIEANYDDESVTLQQTAREICVNPSYLSHIFKKETGVSFTEYLTDVRLEKAMQLLADASAQGAAMYRITDISQKVGYADPYYFTRCFKKKFGCVPSKIGERLNKNIYGTA